MDVEGPVQRQLVAYNARDLGRFIAEYTEDVQVFRPPATAPILSGKKAFAEYYAVNLPALHAEIVNRMILGNKVIDHERITGVGDGPFEAAAVYEIRDGLIAAVWFFRGE